jgi:hypothetical protein
VTKGVFALGAYQAIRPSRLPARALPERRATRTTADARVRATSRTWAARAFPASSTAFDSFRWSTGTRTATGERLASPLSPGGAPGVGIRIVCSWPYRRAMNRLLAGRKNTWKNLPPHLGGRAGLVGWPSQTKR